MSREERQLAIASMHKKDKRLFDKITKIKKAKRAEVRKLESKRKAIDEEKAKKKQKA